MMIHGDRPQDPLEQEAVLRHPVERRVRTTWDDAAPNVEKVNGLYPCSSCGSGHAALYDLFQCLNKHFDFDGTTMGIALAEGRRVRIDARGGPSRKPAQLLPREGLLAWCKELRHRCVDMKQDSMVIIAGATGSSKSTLALQIADLCDETFAPSLDDRLCYDLESLLHFLRTCEKGQVVILDEAVKNLQNVGNREKSQVLAVRTFALCREKGAILLLCSPSLWLIALQVRERAQFWFEVLDRGLALCHRRNEGLRYKQDDTVGFSVDSRVPYIVYGKYPEDGSSPLWDRYSAHKMKSLNDFLEATEEELRSLNKFGHKTKKPTASENGLVDQIRTLKAAGKSVRNILAELKIGTETYYGVVNSPAFLGTGVPHEETPATRPPRVRSAASQAAWERGKSKARSVRAAHASLKVATARADKARETRRG